MRQLILFALLLISCEEGPAAKNLYDTKKPEAVSEQRIAQEPCDKMYHYLNWMADPVTRRCAWFYSTFQHGAVIVERSCDRILKLPAFATIRHCWEDEP